MKLHHKNIEKDSHGSITMTPEEPEDMWHVYNLITVGDSIKATTVRKVTTESATGSTSSNKVRTILTIQIEDIDFDNQACKLRLKGRNIAENQHVKMGAYHTIDVEPQRKFTLTKPDGWDSVALDRVDEACDAARTADLAAIVMQEGLANICLVTSSMTVQKQKIDVTVPRKRRGDTKQHEKALIKFYDAVIAAILRHVNFEVVKCVLIASPGFTKDLFFDHMMSYAQKVAGVGGAGGEAKVLLENKGKFVLCHASSGFKHSLREVLQDPTLQARLSDTKASEEVRALESFYKLLQNEPLKACYGEKHILLALEAQAIECLMISDKLFRAQDVSKRKKFVRIVDEVKEFGGDVKIFSSMHVSGEQLEQLTGICAILRFPMQELDEDSDSSEDE